MGAPRCLVLGAGRMAGEVFAAVATLDQRDEFARLVAFRYHTRAFAGRFAGLAS